MNDFSTYSRQPPDPRQCSDCSSQYLSQSPSQSSYWSRQLINSLFIIGVWSDTKITWWLRYLADEIHLHLMFDPLRKELSNLSPLSLTEIGQLFRVDDIVLMKYPILFYKILNNWPGFFLPKIDWTQLPPASRMTAPDRIISFSSQNIAFELKNCN